MTKEFIKQNYLSMSDEEMAESTGKTYNTIKTYRKRLGLFRFEQESAGTIKGEIWKVVREIPTYSVSNKGRVQNNVTNKICKPFINEKGYCVASLHKAGERYPCKRKVHRLVATEFLSNEDGLLEVNHKDFNKLNNALYNLEWCTRQQNMEHYKNRNLK